MHALAQQGRGPDPYTTEFTAILGPWGYSLARSHGAAHRRWEDVDRVEWSQGYIFIDVHGGDTTHTGPGVVLPSRAWDRDDGSVADFETICGWHEQARVRAGRG